MQHLLDDFREINRRLEQTSEKEQKSHLYMDMIVLIEEIADYIIPEDNEIRKGLGEIMGGKILKLRSEELLEQGEARGRLTGLREGRLTGLHEAKIDAIQNMIDLGLTREQILRKYSPEEYVFNLYNEGKLQTNISLTKNGLTYVYPNYLYFKYFFDSTFLSLFFFTFKFQSFLLFY